jgi:hypothetical protein
MLVEKSMTGISLRGGLGLAATTCAAALLSWALPPIAVTFTDIARTAGITFVHDNALTPEKYLIETMGAGCAWIDYDQDGLSDLYLVHSAATAL